MFILGLCTTHEQKSENNMDGKSDCRVWVPAGWYVSPSLPEYGCLWFSTQINYTQMDNVNRLHHSIEPFAALFWALGIVLAHKLQQATQLAFLASLNHGTSTVLYGKGQLGSIRLKTSWLPAFSFLAVLILCLYFWIFQVGFDKFLLMFSIKVLNLQEIKA